MSRRSVSLCSHANLCGRYATNWLPSPLTIRRNLRAILALIGDVYTYFECLPAIETGPEGKGFSIRARVPNDELRQVHERAVDATNRAAAAYRV
jgi:hypothetical protein